MKKQEEIIAYKAFFKGLKNNIDGIDYQVGKEYQTTKDLQYMKSGFHMCEKPEDCFRFLRPTETEVDLTLVRGFGHWYGFDAGLRAYDDTIGYIYITEKMEILKVFTREEIIDMAVDMPPIRLDTFLYLYPLTSEEAKYLKENYKYNDLGYLWRNTEDNISDLVDHYQKKYVKRKEKKNGQDNN